MNKNQSIVKAQIDMSIKVFKDASELTLRTLQALRDNEACECNPEDEDIGACASCTRISKEMLVGNDAVEIVSITDNSESDLSGAPDNHPNCKCALPDAEEWPELFEN